MQVFRGTYAEWQTKRKVKTVGSGQVIESGKAWHVERANGAQRVTMDESPVISHKSGEAVQPVVAANKSGVSKNAERKRQEQVKGLELQIADTESHLLALSKEIETAGTNGQTSKVRELSADYASAQRALDALWAELGELLD